MVAAIILMANQHYNVKNINNYLMQRSINKIRIMYKFQATELKSQIFYVLMTWLRAHYPRLYSFYGINSF